MHGSLCASSSLYRELQDGVTLLDQNGNKVGESKTAAKWGIGAVCISRTLMASPGMGAYTPNFKFVIPKGDVVSQ